MIAQTKLAFMRNLKNIYTAKSELKCLLSDHEKDSGLLHI